MKECTIDTCSREFLARGWCRAHYQRWLAMGDPRGDIPIGYPSRKPAIILSFIEQYIADKGYPPCIRDIQQGCDISSVSVVSYNLRALERDGKIQITREIARGIRLVESTHG